MQAALIQLAGIVGGSPEDPDLSDRILDKISHLQGLVRSLTAALAAEAEAKLEARAALAEVLRALAYPLGPTEHEPALRPSLDTFAIREACEIARAQLEAAN